MDDFISVIKRDPKVKTKIEDMLDKYIRLPFNYQSKRIRQFDSTCHS